MKQFLRWPSVLAIALLVAAPAAAQQNQVADVSLAAEVSILTTLPALPVINASSIAVNAEPTFIAPVIDAPSPGVSLLILGGAAIVAGTVTNGRLGKAILAGGIVISLVGLMTLFSDD